MKKNEKTIEVLNDLIRINNNRITGYEKAAKEEKDLEPDMPNLFYRMATESRSYVNDLHAEVLRLGGVPVSGATISGKIYLFWLDMKTKFREGYTGSDTNALLTSAEAGEDAVQKAYQHALDSGFELPYIVERLIGNQQLSLIHAHDLMKKYRDEHLVTR